MAITDGGSRAWGTGMNATEAFARPKRHSCFMLARGRDDAEASKILADARAVAEAGCFALVLEGVMEEIAAEATRSVACPRSASAPPRSATGRFW